MTDMFCSEPIIAVHEGQREYDDIFGANSFLDCYHDLAYHVTEGYRIILETESFYISLSATEITKINKFCSLDDLLRAGECIESFTHHKNDEDYAFIEYPATLFVGEHLIKVERLSTHFLLHFDDFDFKVIPHEVNEEDFPSLRKKNPGAYNHVLGADRHLKTRCSCGGEGELLLDFVCDYVVRCKNCKKSTSANMLAYDAIRDWEEKRIECDLSDIVIE